MPRVDYIKDFLPEYKAMVPLYEKRFRKLHPDATKEASDRYVQTQIIRKARTLVDYARLTELVAADKIDIERILLLHKSTRDRVRTTFPEPIDKALRNAKVILDVGCGFNPLLILSRYPNIKTCYAIEPDARVSESLRKVVDKCFPGRAIVINCKIEEMAELKSKRFDLVLAQKVIPLLTRLRNLRAKAAIAAINAPEFLVTGSIKSLSRTVEITQPETDAIVKFAKRYDFTPLCEWRDKNEFGFLYKKEGR